MQPWRHLRTRTWLVLLAGLMSYAMPVHAALEKSFLFFPTSDLAGTPAQVGLEYAALEFTAADGQLLRGWLVPGDPAAPIVLFCMGNYGNMSHRLHNLRLLHQLGVSTFIFDYRGYGQSPGQISEQGSYADLRGAVALLEQHGWPRERMIFFGRSLGAAVALQVAIEIEPAGVILETPFTSIRAMGWSHYTLLYALLGWLVQAEYDNLAKIGALRSPLLILHGTRDTICPPRMARELFAAAGEPKQLEWIEGAGHNDTLSRGGEAYWRVWREFLHRHTGFTGS